LRPLAPLIIDDHVADVRDALARRRAVVLSASPGAGKTTRIPPALIDAGPLILLQPRRVAARAVARRIADEREWTLGREIGWHIRFEKRATRETQLLVVTEGILTARLQQDPLLTDFSTVVLDEFHERSIHADLGLALVRQAWLARSDLRIVVMSATLDVQSVARFLDDAPVVSVPGALHPLTIEYADGESIADAARGVLSRTAGQVLCFLPGAREIERASSDLSSMLASGLASGSASGIAVVPLHGSLDGDAQDAAISPSNVRRIILATNIAETSLTVPGVSAVIDTGQVKVARYDADRGVDSLTLERITTDSAEQRAGRAARLGPGLVRRLWDARDRLRPHREPEIARVDLAGPVLDLLAWGADPLSFDWFEAPSTDRILAALRLLCRLGAADGDAAGARITGAGKTLQRVPLHPRLARILIDARGAPEAAAACARLSLGATGATGATGAMGAAGAPGAGAPAATNVGATRAAMTGVVVAVRPAVFKKEDVLTPEMLRVVYDAFDQNHPAAKAATARARAGKIQGTALMALDAGDQAAGSLLRGIELLMKGDLNPAANQFGVALRNAPDAPIASFFLGACYAAAGRDKEAVSSWERARAAKLDLPVLQLVIADAWLRLGQPADAIEPLRLALERQPQDDNIRRNLAIAQSHLGLHEQAYPTIVPYLERNPKDADALMIALHALYQIHIEGKTIGSAAEDKAKAAEYSRAYAAANGPQQALVEKWAEYLGR
jgi:HrpA-like RNA helicase